MASFRGPLPEYKQFNPGAAYLQGRAMRVAFDNEQELQRQAKQQQGLENTMEMAGIQQKQQKIDLEKEEARRKSQGQGLENIFKAREDARAEQEQARKQQKTDYDTSKPHYDPRVAKGKPPTASEFKAAGYAIRMEEANNIFDALEGGGADFTTLLRSIEAVGPNRLKSAEAQKFEQASRNFINAVLRPESGAAIAESEFENAWLQYIPAAGDGPEVLKQKKRNRQLKQASAVAEASEALEGVRGSLSSIINKADANRLEELGY